MTVDPDDVNASVPNTDSRAGRSEVGHWHVWLTDENRVMRTLVESRLSEEVARQMVADLEADGQSAAPMQWPHLTLDASEIHDWPTFHDTFATVFGFSESYGRNMGSWVEFLSSIREPDRGLTAFHVPKRVMCGLRILGAEDFKNRCPEIYDAFYKSLSELKRRCVGGPPILGLTYDD